MNSQEKSSQASKSRSIFIHIQRYDDAAFFSAYRHLELFPEKRLN